ncbi:MAG: rhomboid family intramembrane serine protease [Gaiellaceae bacterium]
MLPLKDNVPTRSFPAVTVGLVVANLAVWGWELEAGWKHAVIRDAFYPCALRGPCLGPAVHHHLPWYEGVFTSMFMHGSWGHVLGNMLFLWIFGNNIEDALGRFRFLVWYLAAGVAAAALQTLVTLSLGGAAAASVPNVGASGAIASVLGAYFVLLPTASVLTLFLFFPVELPAVAFLGMWFLFQWWLGDLSLLQPTRAGGVAFFAHVGGFLFGAATVRRLCRHRPLGPPYRSLSMLLTPQYRPWN